MNELITSLLGPSAGLPREAVEGLAGLHDWRTFSTLVGKTGCAPLICERLRDHVQYVPQDILDWLEACHDRTVERNHRLLDELRAITTLLAARGVSSLVLKGPVLAALGTGLQTRSFNDLDLLVRPDDLIDASAVLLSRGFAELRSHHPCHRVFVKMAPPPALAVEVHFDLIDAERRYVPELSGVWDRAVTIDLAGCAVFSPSITDHLLLAIMQLPHHVWTPRLLVDIAHVATRWTTTINWGAFIERAQAWGMRALAGSTLRAAESLLHLTLPPAAARFAEPETYVQRVQWHIVQEALSEQLRLDPPRLGRAASCLILDQPRAALALIVRTVFRPGSQGGWNDLFCIGRRLGTGVVTVPTLIAAVSGTVLAGCEGFPLGAREKR